ncbi:MAG: glycosyltransferase family 2 protein [Mucilaginibacter sp.]|nr:glycosyltransferase family 2 protein [Mucilaginibacter sp.]
MANHQKIEALLMPDISVIICTYNPRLDYLQRVLSALKDQSIAVESWELLIIDNYSNNHFTNSVDISWHPNGKIISEPKAGLANARITGVDNASAELIVFVDDDNVLDRDYLLASLNFHKQNPKVGCFGGMSLPVFEVEPPAWFYQTGINLGCQNYGNQLYVSDQASVGYQLTSYPEKAPIGTGMVITRSAFKSYQLNVANNKQRLQLGRKGMELTSGEDNDIILTIVKNGFEVAYLPQLIVNHLIPANRLSDAYLSKMAYQSNKSWIKLLLYHQICHFAPIPKWTLLPRKIKAWILYKAWSSPLNYIKWQGACGTFEALANNG